MKVLAAVLACVVLAATAESAGDEPYRQTLFDAFDADPTPWRSNGMPEITLRCDTAVRREGRAFLAFELQVQYEVKGDEAVGAGWPMLSLFPDPPLDWRAYDRLEFWMRTDSDGPLPSPAIHIGMGADADEPKPWYPIEGAPFGQWQRVSVPLDPARDWSKVARISFYVSERRYRNGQRVTFWFDEMALAARTSPTLTRVTVRPVVYGSEKASRVRMLVEGDPRPPAGGPLHWAIRSREGTAAALREGETALEAKASVVPLDVSDLPAGRYVLALSFGAAHGAAPKPAEVLRPLDRARHGEGPYLLLVTFVGGRRFASADRGWLAPLNASPYHGVAMSVIGAYDFAPVPREEAFDAALATYREHARLHIWPWVFTNRLVGGDADAPAHPSSGRIGLNEYFGRIRALDVADEAGALGDFLKVWRLALRLARKAGAPGVVVDIETYNNNRAYDVAYVAQRRGETPEAVMAQLRRIGERMAMILEEEYPQAVVWTLFTALERPTGSLMKPDGAPRPTYRTPAYITLGLLDHLRRKDLPARVVCGGEVGIGYFNRSPDALADVMRAREAGIAWAMNDYPLHLVLGGTIAPWHDISLLSGWAEQFKPVATMRTAEDFLPFYRALLAEYPYLWIYAGSGTQYDPFDAQIAEHHNRVLRRALEEAVTGRLPLP